MVKQIQVTSTGGTDKSSSDDVVDFVEVRKFLEQVADRQIAALDILLTPDEYIIEKDPIWDDISSCASSIC